MHLEGHHEEGGWLKSTFTLTNRVSWEMMLQAVYAAFEYFADITIFVDDQSVELESRADVLSIPEARSIGIAGESVVVKEPMIIIFYNQVHFINLRIRCGNDDLRDLDYEGFNKIVCPIVDAIELAMYVVLLRIVAFGIEGVHLVDGHAEEEEVLSADALTDFDAISIMFMSGASFLIGCLPSYAAIGIFAPALLLLLRMVQGFSVPVIVKSVDKNICRKHFRR